MSGQRRFTREERVRRGIALLDRLAPEGWRDRVNLGALDCENAWTCPAAQAFDRPWYEIVEQGNDHLAPGPLGAALRGGTYAAGYGFNTYAAEERYYQTAIDQLNAEWVRQLGGDA